MKAKVALWTAVASAALVVFFLLRPPFYLREVIQIPQGTAWIWNRGDFVLQPVYVDKDLQVTRIGVAVVVGLAAMIALRRIESTAPVPPLLPEEAEAVADRRRKRIKWAIDKTLAALAVLAVIVIYVTMHAGRARNRESMTEIARRLSPVTPAPAARPSTNTAPANTEPALSADEQASVERAQVKWPAAFVPGNRLHDAILAERNRLMASNPEFFDLKNWPEVLCDSVAEKEYYAVSVDAAQKRAVALYPALGIKDSAFNKRFVARYAMKDPAYLRGPDWPLRLADEIAAELVSEPR